MDVQRDVQLDGFVEDGTEFDAVVEGAVEVATE